MIYKGNDHPADVNSSVLAFIQATARATARSIATMAALHNHQLTKHEIHELEIYLEEIFAQRAGTAFVCNTCDELFWTMEELAGHYGEEHPRRLEEFIDACGDRVVAHFMSRSAGWHGSVPLRELEPRQ